MIRKKLTTQQSVETLHATSTKRAENNFYECNKLQQTDY